MYLFGVISYYFIQYILLKLVVYVLKLIFLMFLYSLDSTTNFRPFVILMRRQHLDYTTFFALPKGVILKRENSSRWPLGSLVSNLVIDLKLKWCIIIGCKSKNGY